MSCPAGTGLATELTGRIDRALLLHRPRDLGDGDPIDASRSGFSQMRIA
jgi:hypothetical protein